jgi:hypothetical protein
MPLKLKKRCDFRGRPRTTHWRFCEEHMPASLGGHFFAMLLLVSNPAQQRARCHDRRQLVQCPAELLGELHKLVPFLGGDCDPFGQLVPGIWFSTIRYLTCRGQFFVRSADDH